MAETMEEKRRKRIKALQDSSGWEANPKPSSSPEPGLLDSVADWLRPKERVAPATEPSQRPADPDHPFFKFQKKGGFKK